MCKLFVHVFSGFHDTDADNICNACALGFFKVSTGTGACTQSQAGYYASDDSGNGVNTAAETQTICPEGHYSDVGATSCNIAQQGYFASDGDGNALVIPYQGAVGQTQVRAGHYAADSNGDPSSSGAIREEPCLLGFYSSEVGAPQCTQVRAGYFTTDGAGTAVDTAAEAEEACSPGIFLQLLALRPARRFRQATSPPMGRDRCGMAQGQV